MIDLDLKIIIREIKYSIEPNSYGRRVIDKDRLNEDNYIKYQRDWIAVKTPDHFNYFEFSLWFEENCIGYWRYPIGHTFWFSESQDVVRYHFDYYDISRSS